MSTPELSDTRGLVNGCLASERTQVSAASGGVGEATEFIALTLRAWGMPALSTEDVQTLTRWLLEWAIGDRRRVECDEVLEYSKGAMIGVGVIRHANGILVEVCDRIITLPGPRALLELPRPFGSRWLKDADGRPCGRVPWCGIRLPSLGQVRDVG